MNATFCWFWPARADRVEDRVVGDQLFVEEREDGLVPDDAGDVVEQALVRAEGGRRRRGRGWRRRRGRRARWSRKVARSLSWSPANDGFVARSVAKSAWKSGDAGSCCGVVEVGAGVEGDDGVRR